MDKKWQNIEKERNKQLKIDRGHKDNLRQVNEENTAKKRA